MHPAYRLPGVAFQVEPPAPAADLPRMDVAAFVGFAASGPLHLPVPLEDVPRFRELFGPDPVLAWDEARGRLERAHLGPAVESFFRNGGRRCWVVRVAGPAAHTRAFRVPGLETVGGGAVLARARSAGSWADPLRVGTRLVRENLPVQSREPGWIDVAVPPERVLPGDLVEVAPGGAAPAWLLVDRVISRPRGTRLIVRDPETSSIPASPPAAPSVRLLRFELLVWRGERLEARFPDLAFSARHPRFWAALPTDEDLYRPVEGRRQELLPAGVAALRAEAGHPRFPLAGPESPEELYLPLDMGTALDPAVAASPEPAPGDALDRDGLGTFSAALFLEPALAWAGLGAVLGEAEHRFYAEQRFLAGLHSLLPVEEVSLVAVPDAVHRGWTREMPPATPPLGAPELDPIPDPDAFGRYRLTWSPVAGADRYLLQRSASPDFPEAAAVHDGPATVARASLPAGCPQAWFFRVRALRGGEAGPWSNTRGGFLPPPDFFDCAAEPLPELRLSAALDEAGRWRLSWAPAAGEIELQEALDADFESARPLGPVAAAGFDLPEILGGFRFYRVRARRGETAGPWSNTVVLRAGQRATRVLRPVGEPDPGDLLAVQRALLRFCAARGDLLALLSLPGHFREAEVQAHLGALIPGDAGEEDDETFSFVPPLTAGEEAVLGYSALYHPWILWSPDSGNQGETGTRPVPPEGAICGTLARRALGPGAWVAAANEPLERVVGLEPVFSQEAWERLVPTGANLLRRDPRGFLAWSADTLSRDQDLRPVSVRRLLILLRRLALREGGAWVFETNGPDFHALVQHRFERLLSDLYERGAFAGAVPEAGFRVVADASVNPRESLDLGRFIVELRVAPSRPLSFLNVRLVATGPEQLAVQEV